MPLEIAPLTSNLLIVVVLYDIYVKLNQKNKCLLKKIFIIIFFACHFYFSTFIKKWILLLFYVQSFFRKRVVYIMFLGLRPVSNENSGNFTFYRGIHEFFPLYICKNNGFFLNFML